MQANILLMRSCLSESRGASKPQSRSHPENRPEVEPAGDISVVDQSQAAKRKSQTILAPVIVERVGFAVARTTEEGIFNGAGATFPDPIYSKWFSEYHKLHPEVKFNYQAIGSGGGVRRMLDGTIDFGAT